MLALMIGLAAPAAVIGQEANPATLATRVNALLTQVESGSFAQQAQALDELRGLPIEALPLLESAAAAGTWSVDTRQELQAVLRIFRKETRVAQAEASRRREDEACAKEIRSEYDARGERGSWDAAVYAAIDAAYVSDAPGVAKAPDWLAKAKAAGCIDPLVAYLTASHPETPLNAPEIVDALENVPQQLSQRRYPPAVVAAAYLDRSNAAWRAMNGRGTTAQRRRCKADADAACDALARATPGASFNSTRRANMVRSAAYLQSTLAGPGKTAVDAAGTTLDRLTRPDDTEAWKLSIRLTTAARLLALTEKEEDKTPLRAFYDSAAASARQSDLSDTLDVLEARHIAAVWANDSEEASAVFDKLYSGTSDLVTLCRRQLDLLTDNGEADQLVELAGRLAETPLSDPSVPQLCAECYWKAAYVQNQLDPAAEMRQHPDWWDAIEKIHLRYLRRRPNDRMTAARLGWYAFAFRHYDTANQYFQQAGPDQFDPIFGSTTDYNYSVQKAAEFVARGGK